MDPLNNMKVHLKYNKYNVIQFIKQTSSKAKGA